MTRAFNPPLPFARPLLPPLAQVTKHLDSQWGQGGVTKGPIVRDYEKKVAQHLQVKNALAVSSCTTGLMIALKALNVRGDCLVPAFTFTATVQALLWNQVTPVFVDCDSTRFTVSMKDLEGKLSQETRAVLVPYVFGNPPPSFRPRVVLRKAWPPLDSRCCSCVWHFLSGEASRKSWKNSCF